MRCRLFRNNVFWAYFTVESSLINCNYKLVYTEMTELSETNSMIFFWRSWHKPPGRSVRMSSVLRAGAERIELRALRTVFLRESCIQLREVPVLPSRATESTGGSLDSPPRRSASDSLSRLYSAHPNGRPRRAQEPLPKYALRRQRMRVPVGSQGNCSPSRGGGARGQVLGELQPTYCSRSII